MHEIFEMQIFPIEVKSYKVEGIPMYRDLLINLSFILTFLLLWGFVYQKFFMDVKASRKISLLVGVGSGLLGIILMVYTIHIEEHILLDLRHLAIIIAAFNGGPFASILSALIIAFWRIIFFSFNKISIVAAINAIIMGFVCGGISVAKISKLKKYFLMIISTLIFVSIGFYIVLKDKDIVRLKSIYSYLWSITIIGGIMIYSVLEYIKNANLNIYEMDYHRLMTSNMSDLISTSDTDGNYIYVSPSCKVVLGYEAREFKGRKIYEFFHPEDMRKVEMYLKGILSENGEKVDTFRIKKKNGTYIWVEIRAKAIKAVGGEVKEVLSVVRDVDERKIAEEKLIESESRFRSLVNSTNDIIFTLDKQQRYTGVYGLCVNRILLNKSNILGKKAQDIMDEEKSKVHSEANIRALSGENVIYDWFQEEENEMKYYQTSLSPIRNSHGEIIGLVGVGRDITEIKKMEKELLEINETLKQLSFLDGLTQIANRRYFDDVLDKEWFRSLRGGQTISLLVVDIDHFKAYNDTYGHLKGDECLKTVAKTLKDIVKRPGDLAARFGGEEFVVLLPETNLEGACYVAEKIKAAIENLGIPHINSKVAPHVTVSIGVASTMPREEISPEDLIQASDQALYKAKNSGRNRVAS